MKSRRSIVISGVFLVSGCISEPPEPPERLEQESGVFVPGNPTCGELGYGIEWKLEPPVDGVYQIDSINSITVDFGSSSSGQYLDWTSTLGIDAVFVKGSDGGNLYVYDPPEESFGDDGLHAPVNSSGKWAGVSHVSFCFDYEVDVKKTAATSLERKHTWTIDKSADETSLLLATGQSVGVLYTVSVSETSQDSDWLVSGYITVTNPAPVAATITSITDVIDGSVSVDVDCGDVTFPYELASDGQLVCSYAYAPGDGDSGVNVATVTTTGAVGGDDTGDVAFSFDTATVTSTDECVTVDDTLEGTLGSTCEATTYKYLHFVGPYAQCGTDDQVVNTASFVTDDTGATGSDSWTVDVEVADCEDGCSLTQGYWRTHSHRGPAPYDDTWALITPAGADSPFFLSGKTYYQVMWTPSSYGAYYQLAKQYIAAVLNGLNGADTSAVQAQITQATAMFQTYTPSQVKGGIKTSFLSLAAALAAYNEGLTGPGHCSE